MAVVLIIIYIYSSSNKLLLLLLLLILLQVAVRIYTIMCDSCWTNVEIGRPQNVGLKPGPKSYPRREGLKVLNPNPRKQFILEPD